MQNNLAAPPKTVKAVKLAVNLLSTGNTTLHYHEDNKIERLFWSQFNAPACSLPLSEKMAAIAESWSFSP